MAFQWVINRGNINFVKAFKLNINSAKYFLAPLAIGQQAYVMIRCPSCMLASVGPSVNFFLKHLL